MHHHLGQTAHPCLDSHSHHCVHDRLSSGRRSQSNVSAIAGLHDANIHCIAAPAIGTRQQRSDSMGTLLTLTCSAAHLPDVGARHSVHEQIADQARVAISQRPPVPQDQVAVQTQIPRRHRRCPASQLGVLVRSAASGHTCHSGALQSHALVSCQVTDDVQRGFMLCCHANQHSMRLSASV